MVACPWQQSWVDVQQPFDFLLPVVNRRAQLIVFLGYKLGRRLYCYERASPRTHHARHYAPTMNKNQYHSLPWPSILIISRQNIFVGDDTLLLHISMDTYTVSLGCL